MRSNVLAVLAAITVAAGMSVAPVTAGGLLGLGGGGGGGGLGGVVGGVVGGVTGAVGGLLGGDSGGGGGGGGGGSGGGGSGGGGSTGGGSGGGLNVGGLVTVNDNGNNGLVNLDLGGGNNNILNAAVGSGNKPLVNANVSSNGLLNNTTVSLDLAGLGLDLNVDLGVLNPGGPGGPGGPGNPGGPGGPNGPNGPGGRYVLYGSYGGGGNFVINCAVNNARQLLQVAAAGKITAQEIKAWMRAANVQVVPIKLCPAAKRQVAALLAKSQKINLLRRAVMSDPLITASLGRTRYDAGDVAAVQRKGGQLVVYVY